MYSSPSSGSLGAVPKNGVGACAVQPETGLRARQTEALRAMLTTAAGGEGGARGGGAALEQGSWKVLLFDRLGQDLLSPVLNVKALRQEGVTLHLLINADRDPVPDVPAIYFCQPSEENLRRIHEDLTANLYGSYYFHFLSPLPRPRLEDLAAHAIEAQAVSQVKRLFDQYVNFICLEAEMFTLRHQNSSALNFHALNKAAVTDTEMDTMLNQVVDSLFAVCVTLGTIPIIRCPKGNAAEAVATKLDKKIRENLRDARNSLFVADGGLQSGQYSFYRPLLVILDRQVDMATPLHHTWTYQAMAHDVLQYSLNRVTITESSTTESGAQRQKTRTCDLDSSDQLWCSQKGSPFPQVAENIQEELEDYRSREDDIKRMKQEMGVDGGSDLAMGMLNDNTQRLTSAVSSLPALLEKKRLIDLHMGIATAILEQIKMRKLDAFFELEEKLLGGTKLPADTKQQLEEMLRDPEAGTPEDKMRLFLIYYLSASSEEAEITKLTNILEELGCDLSSFRYLQRQQNLNRMTSSTPLSASASSTDLHSDGGTKTISMFSKLIGQGSNFVMEGVKNLVVKKHSLPVTKIVEELIEVRPGKHQDEYRYFDPKILRGTDNVPRAKNPFQEAIVFMVGGGNYIEYQNLLDFVGGKTSGGVNAGLSAVASSASLAASAGSQQGGKRVIYGCTTLTNSNQMMQQLAELGHEM